jgi:hypothetical protein
VSDPAFVWLQLQPLQHFLDHPHALVEWQLLMVHLELFPDLLRNKGVSGSEVDRQVVRKHASKLFKHEMPLFFEEFK